jgi:hypothetical protein
MNILPLRMEKLLILFQTFLKVIYQKATSLYKNNCKITLAVACGAIVTSIIACNRDRSIVEYNGNRQLLSVNNKSATGSALHPPIIKSIVSSPIVKDQELVAKIFLIDHSRRIVSGFVDCHITDTTTVDTLTQKLPFCRRLFVREDTIVIGFRPDSIGSFTFPQIIILTKDLSNVYRTYEYSFDYDVIGGQPADSSSNENRDSKNGLRREFSYFTNNVVE